MNEYYQERSYSELDQDGYFIGFVYTTEENKPRWYTFDVPTGMYKPRYVHGYVDQESGFWSGGYWEETGEPGKEALERYFYYRKQSRLEYAKKEMAPYEDAVYADIATDEEIALLKQWKQYRIKTARLTFEWKPGMTFIDISWPEPPTPIPDYL